MSLACTIEHQLVGIVPVLYLSCTIEQQLLCIVPVLYGPYGDLLN